MAGPILTLPEVTVLLKVARKTVYTMAQTRQILAFNVRGQWQFKHDRIDQSIDEKKAIVKGNAAKDPLDV